MKKIILTGIASAALAFSASAEVKVGNPMAVTGPIPDLVAPMLLAVDLAEKHVNEHCQIENTRKTCFYHPCG